MWPSSLSGERSGVVVRNELFSLLKRFLIGRALKTEQAAHERLSKKTALAVFSSDALSSTAYATEEILLVLAVAAALELRSCCALAILDVFTAWTRLRESRRVPP